MIPAPVVAIRESRPLRMDDLERVIAIDAAHSGHSRRRFFEKRFAAAGAQPEDFVHLGAVQGGSLCGFVIARLHRGEFGREQTVAVLDAIGVETESRERGIGQLLMRELAEVMRVRGVRTLQSQADWTNHELVRFFATVGFNLAPRLMLQRPIAVPLDEAIEEI